ncbi:molecular chaperone, partial [Escherichia coli]|nr:molecular chaperone [Escherichia coli]HAH3493278.1 molecular chaperone [Escherichia coli]
IPPFSSTVFALKGRTAPASKVSWVIVNDYGGYQQGESVLE